MPITLVPKVEWLTFMHVNVSTQSGQIMASGSWEDVARVLGRKIEATDFYPEQYRFVGFPTEAELAKIGING